MNILQGPLEHLLSQKCQFHTFHPLGLIDIKGNSEHGRKCFLCVKSSKQNLENFLSLQEVFTKQQGEILPSFPPLDENIKLYLEKFQKQSIKSIEDFFSQIRESVKKAIQAAESKTKKLFISYEAICKNLYQEWSAIAEIEKLKDLLIKDNQQLNEFLKEKWRNAENNSNRLHQAIEEINKNQIDFNQKKEEIKKIIYQIQKFELFEKEQINSSQNLISSAQASSLNLALYKPHFSILKSASLISSKYGNSEKLTQEKTGTNFLQMVNNFSFPNYGDAFLNQILNPKKKYIIRLNYQPNIENIGGKNYFFFGIVSDQKKNLEWSFNSKMAYYNQINSFGITTYIKGPNIHSNQRKNIKESFELRIQLSKQILKVASYPDYSSILELDNPNKIDPQISYRFFIHIGLSKDILEITEILETIEFDQKF